MIDRIASTPAIVIDEGRMRANVDRMRDLAGRNGLALSPHVKTHKSIELARIQMDAGVFGFTASKPEEAAVFLRAGVPSLTVAYPIVAPSTIARLLELAAAERTTLRFVVDSHEGIDALELAAGRLSIDASAFLEVDVGLGRCGAAPGSDSLLSLARRLDSAPRLGLAGLLSHAGHAYGATGRAAVERIAGEERATMTDVRAALDADGIAVPVVSVGSTPTVLAAASFDGIDEIRPGNYIVLDAIQVGLGVASVEEVALSVLATIVSRSDTHYIVDAGSKTLSSDRGAHGAEGPPGFGAAFTGEIADRAPVLPVVRLSEEHGFVARGGTDLAIGSRVRIVPNHACPVINLARSMYLAGEELREIAVDAGGCVH